MCYFQTTSNHINQIWPKFPQSVLNNKMSGDHPGGEQFEMKPKCNIQFLRTSRLYFWESRIDAAYTVDTLWCSYSLPLFGKDHFFITYIAQVSFLLDKWEPNVTLKAETSTLMLEQKSLYNLMHSLHLIQLIHSTYLHFTTDLSCSSQSHALLNTVFCVHTYLTSDNSGGERGRHWSLKQARRLLRIGKCNVIHSLLICQSSTNHFHGAFSISSYTSEDMHASLWAACAWFLGKQPDVLNFPYVGYHCWASIMEPCYWLMLCVNRRGNPWYVPYCAFFQSLSG